MTDPPKGRRGRPVDPFAIVAVVLGAIAFLRPGLDYLPGVAVGIVGGVLAVLLGIAGVAGARGRVPMVVISVIGIALGLVGAAISLVGVLRIAS